MRSGRARYRRNLKDGVVEVQPRGGEPSKVARPDAVVHLVEAHHAALASGRAG